MSLGRAIATVIMLGDAMKDGDAAINEPAGDAEISHKAPSKTRRLSQLLSSRPVLLRFKTTPMIDKGPKTITPASATLHSPASFFRRLSRKNNWGEQQCHMCEESLAMLELGERVLTFGVCRHLVHGNCVKDLASTSESLKYATCPKCIQKLDILASPLQTPVISPRPTVSLPSLSPGRASIGTGSVRSFATTARSIATIASGYPSPLLPKSARLPAVSPATRRGKRVPFPVIHLELATRRFDTKGEADTAHAATLKPVTELILSVSMPDTQSIFSLMGQQVLTPPISGTRHALQDSSSASLHYPVNLVVIVQLEGNDPAFSFALRAALLQLCNQLQDYDDFGVIAFSSSGEHNVVYAMAGAGTLTERMRWIHAMTSAGGVHEAAGCDVQSFEESWQTGGLQQAMTLAIEWFGQDRRQVVQQELILLATSPTNSDHVPINTLRASRIQLHTFGVGPDADALNLWKLAYALGGQYNDVAVVALLERRMLAVLLGIFSLAYSALGVQLELLDEHGNTIDYRIASPQMLNDVKQLDHSLRLHFGSCCIGESRQVFLQVQETQATHLFCQVTIRGRFTNKQRSWTGLSHLVVPIEVQTRGPSPAFGLRKLEELAGLMVFRVVDLVWQREFDMAERVIHEIRLVLLLRAKAQMALTTQAQQQDEDDVHGDSSERIVALDSDLQTLLSHFKASAATEHRQLRPILAYGLALGRALLLQQAWAVEPDLMVSVKPYAQSLKLLRDSLNINTPGNKACSN